MRKPPDIDIRGQVGDYTYTCPVCHWTVTLRPSGAQLWTENFTIVPTCQKDRVPLTVTIRRA